MTNWTQELTHLEREKTGFTAQELTKAIEDFHKLYDSNDGNITRGRLDRLAISGTIYEAHPAPRENLILLIISLASGLFTVLAVVLFMAALISPEALVR